VAAYMSPIIGSEPTILYESSAIQREERRGGAPASNGGLRPLPLGPSP